MPVILHLLTLTGYPDVAGITEDLTEGFQMLGRLRPGPGWTSRRDSKYSDAAPAHQFRHENYQYIKRKTRRRQQDEYASILASELYDEVRLGRTMGPARAPASWPVTTQAVPTVQDMAHLIEPPDGELFAALSFAIIQSDEKGDVKVRRGEDWRRSHHNSTVLADDVPTHHFVGDFVEMARHMYAEGGVPVVLGHDLLSAYRQWPVSDPAENGTFLFIDGGWTLWFHHAMCFGAAASVWNFNRAADALQHLLRSLLLIVVGHYVDDFNALEFMEQAMSAFDGFAELFELLGLNTKATKAQPPAAGHVLQGVWFEITPDGVKVAPTEKRVAKLCIAISKALDENSLTPTEAQRLAGRLAFVTQQTFGGVGRAALKPVYSRAALTSAADASDALDEGLRAALLALRRLLPQI